MKKQILNIGKALNKVEQKQINGGLRYCVVGSTHCTCPPGEFCKSTNSSGSGYCIVLNPLI